MSETEAPWWEGLTERQRRFCEAYSISGNALDAARVAGYKKPDPEGSRLLGNARVKAAFDKLREKTTKASIMTREQRQELWTSFALDAGLDPKDRLKASELLGKAQADFINRTEITGANGGPISTEILIRFVDE